MMNCVKCKKPIQGKVDLSIKYNTKWGPMHHDCGKTLSHADRYYQQDEESERERFEKWISSPPRGFNVCRHSHDDDFFPGKYVGYRVRLAWEAWQQALESK